MVNIKRKLSIILILLLVITSLPKNNTSYAEKNTIFSDISGHYAQQTIIKWENSGIINGYKDNTFRPNNYITRAEFVNIIANYLNLKDNYDVDFKDVSKKSWYYDALSKTYHKNIIAGYKDNTFKPNINITRQEASVIFYKIASNLQKNIDVNFLDNEEISPWARESIMKLAQSQIIKGYPNGTFKPKNNITRAEVLVILNNIEEKNKETNDKKTDDKEINKKTSLSSGGSGGGGSHNQSQDKNLQKKDVDTDKDGFSDEIEKRIGTDPQKSDTDEDGLTDFEEFYISNPTINDSKNDFDGDGISNIDEIKKYSTSAIFKDTDFEGLTDYEEIFIYKTNPLQLDTDEDGISDFDEVKNKLNPLVPENPQTSISKNFKDVKSENLKLDLDINTNIDNYYNISVMPISDNFNNDIINIVGYMGGFDINAENFNYATMNIKYTVPDGKTVGVDFIPTLYYYNEQTKELEKIEEAVVDIANNTISYKPKHFSIYVILDEYELKVANKANADFLKQNAYSTNPLNIVLVIDSSGSMSSNDRNDLRKSAAKDLIDSLSDKDSAAIVDFDESSEVLQYMTNDKSLLKDAIDNIDSRGGTDIKNGLEKGFTTITTPNILNITTHNVLTVLFTDGEDYSRIEDYSEIIKMSNDMNVKIFTMGLGSKYNIDEELLKGIANSTGGKYYHISEDTLIIDTFKNGLREDIKVDTDGDGLPDIEEQLLKTKTGFFKSDPKKYDTDEDGLNDLQEREKGTDPNKSDTDGDGLIDSKDKNPTNYDVTDYTLALTAKLSYNNLENKKGKNLKDANVDKNLYKTISDWIIVGADNSGKSDEYWINFLKDKAKDILNFGFGYIAIKDDKNVIYSLRGTDFSLGTHLVSDGITDLLAASLDTNPQEYFACSSYRNICNNYPNKNYFISGHSLGGRLAQDTTLYSIKRKNDEFFGLIKADNVIIIPKHTATFNALGYNKISHFVKKFLTRQKDIDKANSTIKNYYIKHDEVGDWFGDSIFYEKYGKNKVYEKGEFLHFPFSYHDLDFFIVEGQISDSLKENYR